MRNYFYIFFITIGCPLFGQDLQYAKDVIDTLCSEKMKGRGYVKKGDQLAANYIATEFEKAKLTSFSKSCFYQELTTPVNTFPGKMIVRLNNLTLIPGEDFLVDPGSPGVHGKFGIVKFNVNELLLDNEWKVKLKSAQGKVILVEPFDKALFTKEQIKKIGEVTSFLLYAADNPSKGTIIVSNEKLTWSGATSVNSKPGITIRAAALKEIPSEIEFDIDNSFIKNYKTQNVIGYFQGQVKDSILVYTAHYDHLGMMGAKTMFPGANDNASGVAMLLSLVKYFSLNPPKYTTVFIAFSGEEIGLVGSKYFTAHPLFDLKKIKFLVNFDMAGTGDDGIQIVNGKIYPSKFNLITQINNELNLVKQVKIRGEACNSDHCMFYAKGVPCFFIYTLGGIKAYHDIEDKPATLPLTDFEDYFKLIVEFIKRI